MTLANFEKKIEGNIMIGHILRRQSLLKVMQSIKPEERERERDQERIIY